MEQKRGISITSAVLQFDYRDHVINLLDTPGPRRLLRGHLPGARRRRRRGDAARRGQGPRAADAQAVRRLPRPRDPRADVRQQVGPPRPRGPRAARRGGADDRAAAHAGHLAGRASPGDLRGAGRARRPASCTATRRTAGGATRGEVEIVPPSRPRPRRARAWGRAAGRAGAARRDRRRVRREGLPRRHRHPGPVRRGAAELRRRPPAGRAGRPRARRPARDATPTATRARSTRRSPAWCSRCRRAWTTRTATAWRSCASARAASSAAWCSPTPPPGARSPPSTPSRCSAASAPPSRRRSPATSSGWSTRARCARATRCTTAEPVTFPPIPSFAPEHFAVARGADAGRSKQFRTRHRPARLRGRRPGAALGPARRPGPGARRGRPAAVRGGRQHGWPTSSARRSSWTTSTTRWPGSPTRRAPNPLVPGRGRGAGRRQDGALLAVFANKWRLETIRRKFPDMTLQPAPWIGRERACERIIDTASAKRPPER